MSRVRRVDPAAISVVVQGPIAGSPDSPPGARLTSLCVESVRRHLPGAEIVLSTWRGSDVSGLSFDVLVESADPGTVRCEDPQRSVYGPVYYNADRQMVSTLAGVQAATRSHAIKLRSDMLLTGTGFLDYFGRYPARHPEWRVLRERVVVPNYFSRNPRNRLPYPFHPSDWFQFGLRADLLTLWDTPMVDPEVPRWFETRPRPPSDPEPWALYRYTMEQWAWLSCLRKHGEIPFDHKFDTSNGNIELSELVLANNLVVVDRRDLGIRFAKYLITLDGSGTLYTHGEWQQLYRWYCAPEFPPNVDLRTVRKRIYNHVLATPYEMLTSPRRSRFGARLITTWSHRSPRSFRVAKRLYERAWSAFFRFNSR